MTAPRQVEPDVEVLAYAREVRAVLADVPAARLAEVLDDLEEHLVEVAGEGGEPLTVRLGPPAVYAAELRRAAGLPASSGPTGPTGSTWRAGFDESLDRLRVSRRFVAVRDFLPELRPAWWVLRAWAPLVAVDAVFFGRTSFPVPSLGLSPVVGLVLAGAAITWSVRRGLRARQDPDLGDPRLAVAVNGVLALLAFVALLAVADQPEPAQAYDYPGPGPSTLTHEDGAPITNIHPYSSTGEPLTGVLLYDQDGRPIDNLAEYAPDGGEVQRLVEGPPAPANSFPQEQRVVTYDEFGNPVWVAPSTAPAPSAPEVSTSAPSAPPSAPEVSPSAPSTPPSAPLGDVPDEPAPGPVSEPTP